MELKVGMKAKITKGHMVITKVTNYEVSVRYFAPGEEYHDSTRTFDKGVIADYYDVYFIKSAWQVKFRYK